MFVNAMQVNDMAISGLEKGFASAVSSLIDNMNRAADIRNAQLEARREFSEIAALRGYAESLEENLDENIKKINGLINSFNSLLDNAKKLAADHRQLTTKYDVLVDDFNSLRGKSIKLESKSKHTEAKLDTATQRAASLSNHLNLVAKRMLELNNQYQWTRAMEYALKQLHWDYSKKVTEKTGEPAESFMTKEEQKQLFIGAFRDYIRLQDMRHPIPNADGTPNESFAKALKEATFNTPMTEILFHPYKIESYTATSPSPTPSEPQS